MTINDRLDGVWFLEGSLAKTWLPVQAAYLISQRSMKTAKTWASGFVRQLWKVAFQMWQHRNTWGVPQNP
jgi:hypothetical protein